jgi:antitoxin-like ribbon-helix-helix protein
MARKSKPLLPADLDLDDVRTAPGTATRPAFLHEQVEEPSPPGGLKGRATATTLYLMPADHRRLRKLAIDRNVSMQTLILDAIDLLMARESEAPVQRWETRRKER